MTLARRNICICSAIPVLSIVPPRNTSTSSLSHQPHFIKVDQTCNASSPTSFINASISICSFSTPRLDRDLRGQTSACKYTIQIPFENLDIYTTLCRPWSGSPSITRANASRSFSRPSCQQEDGSIHQTSKTLFANTRGGSDIDRKSLCSSSSLNCTH